MNTALDLELEDDTGADERFDKLREECGVMAVYNHADAARLTYWGLVCVAASRAGVGWDCGGGWAQR